MSFIPINSIPGSPGARSSTVLVKQIRTWLLSRAALASRVTSWRAPARAAAAAMLVSALLILLGLLTHSTTDRALHDPAALVWRSGVGPDDDAAVKTVWGPVQEGTALIAACRNKHEPLHKVFPTWVQVGGLDEIVVVDWSSATPITLETLGIRSGRRSNSSDTKPTVRIVRVEGEREWVLTRAFNVAARVARRKRLLRVDCDHGVSRAFLQHPRHAMVGPGRFVAGNWKEAKTADQVHMNGLAFVWRDDFWKVGGYDERIQTYGWDDEDFYGRLVKAGVQRDTVEYSTVLHLAHNDKDRAQQGVRFVEVEVDYNSLLLSKLPPWGPRVPSTAYRIVRSDENQLVIEGVQGQGSPPASLARLVDEEQRAAAWGMALGRRLHDEYGVPWDLMINMTGTNKEKLLQRMTSGDDGTREPADRKKLFVLHAMHGLGNRMRALGSAMSYAQRTKRELVVIWEKNHHISARFNDLFVDDDFVVLEEFTTRWEALSLHAKEWDTAWSAFAFYNYMEAEPGAQKNLKIEDEPDRHIYYKGAFVVNNPKVTNWNLDSAQLRNLKPVTAIMDIMKLSEARCGRDRAVSQFVGVHIRDRKLDTDIFGVDVAREYGEEAVDVINHWRTQSSYKNFIPKMIELLRAEPNTRFYVASDTYSVFTALEQHFPPGTLCYIPRPCDERGTECMQYAVADILLLSQTRMILGSQWSSFTEAAQRLSGSAPLYLAGLDFAVADEDRVLSEERQRKRQLREQRLAG